MKTRIALALVLLALGAATARAQEIPVIGTFTVTGQEDGRPVSGTVTIRASGDEIALVATFGTTVRTGRGSALAGTPLPGSPAVAHVGTGSWVVTLDPLPTSTGLASLVGGIALGGAPGVATATSRTLELRPVAKGGVDAVVRQGPKIVGRDRLTRQRAALLVHNDTYDDHNRSAFRVFAAQVASYYRSHGYARTDFVLGTSAEAVIAALAAGETEGHPYERVVVVGHGGWDGPYYWGQGGTSQVSPELHPELFDELARAVRRGTTSNARIFLSSCHAGGSNDYEVADEIAGGQGPRLRYVDVLAKATGRTVAGPQGKTSTEYTLQAVKAVLEGDGVTVQQTRIATGAQARSIPSKHAVP